MNLSSKSGRFLYSAIPLFHHFTLKNLVANHMHQRALFLLLARHNHDRFTFNQRKKKLRKNASQVRKALWKQSQVFQLDPVKEEDTCVISDTKQQKTLSQAILQGITDMLMGPELDGNLQSYQVEITEVKITKSLRHATIYWSAVTDKLDECKEDIQSILDENADHIRMLLPTYTTLNRFPSLIFTKDIKADLTREVENLLKEARNRDNCEETSEMTFEDTGPA